MIPDAGASLSRSGWKEMERRALPSGTLGAPGRRPKDDLDGRRAVPDDLAEGRVRAEGAAVEAGHPHSGQMHSGPLHRLPYTVADALTLRRVDQVCELPADEAVLWPDANICSPAGFA